MIIIVAGSNGAGKSTAVEAVLSAGVGRKETGAGRERGYDLVLTDVPRTVRVIGPYFTTGKGTRGCDALADVQGSYEVIRSVHDGGQHVLYEGMRMMGHQDGLALFKYAKGDFKYAKGEMHVVLLNSDAALCTASIRERRLRRGDETPLSATTVETVKNNLTRAVNYAAKLAALGCPRTRVDRALAPEMIISILRGAQ